MILSTTLPERAPGAFVEFIATRAFEASAKKLLDEEDRRQLELMLLADPRKGQLIERTGGFRKVRFARSGRSEGKSGGTRVIYYFIQRKARIYLVGVYAKGIKDDLTRAEENGLREVARVLEGEE